MSLPLQATKFEAGPGAGSQVQHLFNIMSTLLEARMLALKQKCAPAALAASSSDGSKVEALLDRVSNAIKVICLGLITLSVCSKDDSARRRVAGGSFLLSAACALWHPSSKTMVADAIKVGCLGCILCGVE